MSLSTEQSIEKVLDLASQKKVSAEALVIETKKFNASFQDQALNDYEVTSSRSLGIRVVDGSHEGISYTESFSTEDIESTFLEAQANKNFVTSDCDPSFPEAKSIVNNMDFFNPQLSEVPVDLKLEFAKNLETYAKASSDKFHSLPWSAYADIEAKVLLCNTSGTQSSYQTNSCHAYAYPLCVNGDKRGMAFAAESSRNFYDLSAERIAKKSIADSVLKLEDTKPKSGKYSIVLQSKSAQTLLSLLVSHLSLKSIDQNLSALKNKLNEQLFSEKFHLIDDATYAEGMAARPFDAEGTKSSKNTLIEDGILKSYLTSFGYANKYNLKNTGNATRSTKSGINISSTNLLVRPGKLTFNELVDLDSEVLVVDNLKGLSGVNPISGDFSIESEGLLYRQGQFHCAVSNFTLSGNIFETLKNIEELGNDVEPTIKNIYSPSMFVGKMSVAGA
ncbi:MAG: TldD/PmbA family protein [Bdellovibrionales bacterium]|nr:TldD/PmbA family protein [Bdellovibrionales bacterium]